MVVRLVVSALVICGVASTQHQSASDPWKQHMDSGRQFESRGQYAEARQEMEAALRVVSDVPKDTRGFLSRVELGTVAASAGQYFDAERWDNEALRLGMELYGKDSPALAVPFASLAALYRDQGDDTRAEEFCRRALQLAAEDSAGGRAVRANVLGVLGGILTRRGKLEEAENSLQQSIQIAEKLPAGSGILAADWSNLAGIYAKTGRNDQALALYHEAYAACEKAGGRNDPNLFFILAGMAAIQARSGKYSDAVTTIQSAIQHWEAGEPTTTMQVRDALWAEAEWLHKLKRDGEARRVRAKAKQVAQAATRNSYSQYTVDARQIAQGVVGQAKSQTSGLH
jgi:tetratricopeptide (TPR) repeat protein